MSARIAHNTKELMKLLDVAIGLSQQSSHKHFVFVTIGYPITIAEYFVIIWWLEMAEVRYVTFRYGEGRKHLDTAVAA